MRLKKIKISNYRNLDNISFDFEDNINFIVGENNLGKSNFLNLLKIIFKQNSFHEEDFYDQGRPIEIEFSLKLTSFEIGHFSDLFDPNDNFVINIICRQNIEDDYIQYFHKETDINISRYDIRALNFIYYDSLRNPTYEINFDRNRGVGKFLNKIIISYFAQQNPQVDDFINVGNVEKLLDHINSKLEKLKIFKDFTIKANVDVELINILSNIIGLKEIGQYNISKIGYGVQFFILILLSILDQIDKTINSKRSKAVFEFGDKKYISLVLGLDEPEIHLHPYMQRSLIKYLSAIISNKNSAFQNLIKELWGIDGFDGQIIITTHSPNIILNSYKQIIRFYKENDNKVNAVSGNVIDFTEQEEKHIYLQFPFIKEALFSKGVIFVEGDTELGALSSFAEKLGFDFDEFGISIIKASGKGSIEPLIKLVQKFKIKGIGIKDRDDETITSSPPLFLTNKRDFEEEVVSKLLVENKEVILRRIVEKYDSQGKQRCLSKKAINKRLFKNGQSKYEQITNPITSDLTLANCTNDLEYRYFYLGWFLINKTILLGRLIGEILSNEEIPDIYKKIINEAIDQ